VVSLTFDDVPRTAVTHGVPALERFGAKATFYVSLGMFEREPEAFIGRDEVVELERQGHEVACHTYSHYRLSDGSADGLFRDCRRNQALLADATQGAYPKNFSYPFGGVSFSAKRKLAAVYASMRGTCGGINAGRVDLNFLRANSFTRAQRDDARARLLLREAREKGGWVIFYTHGISDHLDCDSTVDGLDALLHICAEEAVEFATVEQVLERLRGESQVAA
jgi:peptidoglycan/xylan/chitin deacetylase (PgdA/CDA1 family)